MAWDDIQVGGNGGTKSDIEYMKLSPGTPVKMRILDSEPFSRWVHWLNKQGRSITCGGGDCPICAVIKAQKANGETPQYSSVKKHVVHVWNYSTNRIEFFEKGNTVFTQLGSFHKMLGDIRDADITVMQSGSGKQVTHTFLPDTKSPIAQSIVNAYNEKKVNFTERYNAPKVEDVKKLMAGMSFDEVYKQEDTQAVAPTQEPATTVVDFTTA